jgi:lipopolysaccharide export LptBFGC system permease protein LptF
MNPHQASDPHHRGWLRLYRALSVAMPRDLRDKHGAAMTDLFERELQRSASAGRAAVTWTAAVGLGDLVRRGLYERVVEERTALTAPNRQLLMRLAKTFLMSFALLTGLLVANYSSHRASTWSHSVTPFGTQVEELLLAIPFTVALTLPMAIFIAVLATAGRERTSARREEPSRAPHGLPRLRLAPLIGLASVVALFAFAWNAEVVPRANARLQALQTGRPTLTPSDRSMTLRELRRALRRMTQQHGANPTPAQRETVAQYGIESHKKPALAAACVVLALLACGIARRVPRAGTVVQGLASGVVFTVYYVLIMGGESLAGRLVLPPMLAMWSANAVMLGVAIVALQRPRRVSVAH